MLFLSQLHFDLLELTAQLDLTGFEQLPPLAGRSRCRLLRIVCHSFLPISCFERENVSLQHVGYLMIVRQDLSKSGQQMYVSEYSAYGI